jgi:hypothetical protein
MLNGANSRVKRGIAIFAVLPLALTPALATISVAASRVSLDSIGSVGSFTPAMADPELAAQLELRALKGNKAFRFTPAGQSAAGVRSVTIVVRQSAAVNAIGVRSDERSAPASEGERIGTAIAPVSYSLGAAKGWKSFALPATSRALPVRDLGDQIPDLADFGSRSKAVKKADDSRFNANMSLQSSTPTGSAARSFDASERDVSVDVRTSYSLTRNLDVTAGVRINNERDRLVPLTDARQDSQAVYVGTQIRF